MSGTALYRALIHAGAPDEEAKEAAGELDTVQGDISEIKAMLAEMRAINRLILALILVIFVFILRLSFA